jgi:outer membrane biosynthesis protein TonB
MRVKKRVKRGVKKGIKSVKSAPPEAYLASVGVLVGGAAVLLLATTKSGRELLSRTAQLALRPEADEQESQESGGTVVGGLTREVGGRLFDAGKTAATSVVASRIGTLSESLAERSQNMRMGAPGGQAGKSRADEAEDDREAEQPTDESEEQKGEEPEQPTDESEEQKGEEPEEPTDESEEQEASRDEEPEEPVARSPRRRRSASPAGRRTPSPAATSSSRPRPAAKKSSSSESSPSRPRPAAKKSSSSASSRRGTTAKKSATSSSRSKS